MLAVKWIQSTKRSWLPLRSVNLKYVRDVGVYVIWHEGNPGRFVRVGQGQIAVRLSYHRADPNVMQYEEFGTLRVTWASVQTQYRSGVERFLADLYQPLTGDVFPEVDPIQVNLVA